MYMNRLKSFTILKVSIIVIIAVVVVVVAVIVLGNVVNQNGETQNSIIKENMSAILANAKAYYDRYGNYMNFKNDAWYISPAALVQSANGGIPLAHGFNTVTGSWCACSPLKATRSESGTFCIDSSKHKIATKTDCTARCASGADETDGSCQP